MRASVTATGFLIATLVASTASAQGKGRKVGQQRPATTAVAPVSGTAAAAQVSTATLPGAGIRQFGSWLDDASVLPAGGAWAAVSFGHSRSQIGSQTDFPVMDGAVGLTERVQFGATLPYYRAHLSDGISASGFGDVYFSGKVALIDPSGSRSRVGLAVSPLMEVLSAQDPATGGRWFWGIPVSVEFRGDGFRLYGAGGYFSRGAFFGGGALEVPLTDRVIVSGALIQMISLHDDPAADALLLNRNRLDVAGSAAYVVSPSVAVFGSVGRTISSVDVTGTSFTVNGGVSVSLAPRRAP